MVDLAKLEKALDALPNSYRGPGGVAGVVKDGKVIASRAWGYSDLSSHRKMSAKTRLPICSISKQFTCGVMLHAFEDFTPLNERLADLLPNFKGTLPTVKELADNQSGLRDYWALTILQGAKAEQTFARDDAFKMFDRIKSCHFEPGTSYSYCNGNFRLLGEVIERETGRSLQGLYNEIIWGPAGMKTVALTPDSRVPADDVVGYEGSETTGFMPADNGIYWFGDAGISASLEDMLAYESWIDSSVDDPNGLYQRLSVEPTFKDGSPASYGYGLAHMEMAGRKVTGHAGALRGFRAFRMHCAEERLSVVVIFNHEADTFGAAASLFHTAIGHQPESHSPIPLEWEGQWLCEETGMLARIKSNRSGGVLTYSTSEEAVFCDGDKGLKGEELAISRSGETLTMTRSGENLTASLTPLPTEPITPDSDLEGRYYCDELDATLTIVAEGGGLYARCEGILGVGIMERIHPVGPDAWVMVTLRSMDAPAPGDWTVLAKRDTSGKIESLTIGCWLARKISYRRL
ncbi:D-stereospecific aminopeptidase Serine peptidase. MEROPS family S12 [Cohaesibacter sp. ES.047]|uniref:D-aminopeptidase n=1 Tax=Cohaesibacter sp. ES.047 TaxID=1798205 RepID=UPI000BC097DF|nr:D-aminopeptidase [Cohaesibacter sp. ES.047]SNY93101.1 D-stereospecific aminopeptidase Serine peptidase. MEROPS family S12 [Cohaesibacter sp. ES.047]